MELLAEECVAALRQAIGAHDPLDSLCILLLNQRYEAHTVLLSELIAIRPSGNCHQIGSTRLMPETIARHLPHGAAPSPWTHLRKTEMGTYAFEWLLSDAQQGDEERHKQMAEQDEKTRFQCRLTFA